MAEKKQKDPSNVVNYTGERNTIEVERPPSAVDEYAHGKNDSDDEDIAKQHGLLFKKLR